MATPPLLLTDNASAQYTELLHECAGRAWYSRPSSTATRTLARNQLAARERARPYAAANLAMSLARLNQRVLLIDADLRRPRLHDVFGYPAAARTDRRAEREGHARVPFARPRCRASG